MHKLLVENFTRIHLRNLSLMQGKKSRKSSTFSCCYSLILTVSINLYLSQNIMKSSNENDQILTFPERMSLNSVEENPFRLKMKKSNVPFDHEDIHKELSCFQPWKTHSQVEEECHISLPHDSDTEFVPIADTPLPLPSSTTESFCEPNQTPLPMVPTWLNVPPPLHRPQFVMIPKTSSKILIPTLD